MQLYNQFISLLKNDISFSISWKWTHFLSAAFITGASYWCVRWRSMHLTPTRWCQSGVENSLWCCSLLCFSCWIFMLSTFGKAAAVASSTQRLCRCLQACSSFPVFVTTRPHLCWTVWAALGGWIYCKWINLREFRLWKSPCDPAALTVWENLISLLHNQGREKRL